MRWVVSALSAMVLGGCQNPVAGSTDGGNAGDASDDPRCTICPTPWGVGPTGCTDVRVDPANCGSCGSVCASGVCSRGVCVNPTCSLACAGTTVCCSDACTNPNRDLANCGECGHRCNPGAACETGECVCIAPRTACSDACTMLDSDPNNCGACGHTCGATEPYCYVGECHECMYGTANCGSGCMDVLHDGNNCGECGHGCTGPGLTGGCFEGKCSTCVDAGQADCGGTCMDVQWNHERCGSCGHACSATQACVHATCVPGNATCAGGCTDNQVCCSLSGTPTCVDLAGDDRACGSCTVSCSPSQLCSGASCVSTSGD